MLDALETHYGAMPRSRVIWNGRDGSMWHSQPVKERSVVSVGRIWDDAKNIHALDSIAADLDWPVVVAGSWERPDGSGKPPENIQCLGVVPPDELADWYGRAAIFALPARYEPFGLSILEAALSGCALVLGDIPSLHELWSGAAVFVPPDDHEALSRELRSLIARPAYLTTLSLAARCRARSYGTERMVMRYLDVYADLLDVPRTIPLDREIAAVPSES